MGWFFNASLPFSVPSLVLNWECCPVIKLPRESIKILVTTLHDNILEGCLVDWQCVLTSEFTHIKCKQS